MSTYQCFLNWKLTSNLSMMINLNFCVKGINVSVYINVFNILIKE